jgi:hypothetical protein
MIKGRVAPSGMAAARLPLSHAFQLTRVAQPGLYATPQQQVLTRALMSVLSQPASAIDRGPRRS